MSDMPLLRQGVAALNATPPGQWHITQVPGWLSSLAEGCTCIVFLPGLLREVGWPGNRGSRAPTEPYV